MARGVRQEDEDDGAEEAGDDSLLASVFVSLLVSDFASVLFSVFVSDFDEDPDAAALDEPSLFPARA